MTLRSLTRLIYAAVLSAGLLGCSSTYVLTNSASSTLATLDQQRALAIVARYPGNGSPERICE